MNILISGTPDFHFTLTNPLNGTTCAVGASASIGGDETGFRPMQLLLGSVGTCSGVDVVNILKKSRVDFDKVDVEVIGGRKEGVPSPFSSVLLKFRIIGRNIDQAKAEKAVSLAVEKYCSAVASLDKTITVEHRTEIIEAS